MKHLNFNKIFILVFLMICALTLGYAQNNFKGVTHLQTYKWKNYSLSSKEGFNNNVSLDTPQVITSFEGGFVPNYKFKKNQLAFDVTGDSSYVSAMIRNVPSPLELIFYWRDDSENSKPFPHFYEGQGLMVQKDMDQQFVAHRYERTTFKGLPALRAVIDDNDGNFSISTIVPYTRSDYESLLVDTRNFSGVNVYYLRQNKREVPVFEFGRDDGRKPVHVILCGEDAWETPAKVWADVMIRRLLRDEALRKSITENYVLRIIPLLSPYVLSENLRVSHLTLEGEPIYSAGAWGDKQPPPEIELLRKEVEALIHDRRLAFMTTIHSWAAQAPFHGLETIKSAGNNTLKGARLKWARQTVEKLVANIESGKSSLPDEAWHKGLARDYLLKKHNVITFRIEVSSQGGNIPAIKKAGEQFIENIATIKNWQPVLP